MCTAAAQLFCLIVASFAVHAQQPSIADCIKSSSALFGLSPQLVLVVGHVESGWKCEAVSRENANGTFDIGCMQINTSWLPLLSKKFGITKDDLYNPCTNIHVGSWLLAKNKQTYGDTWRAIGAYNAVTESKRVAYAWKIRSRLPSS